MMWHDGKIDGPMCKRHGRLHATAAEGRDGLTERRTDGETETETETETEERHTHVIL